MPLLISLTACASTTSTEELAAMGIEVGPLPKVDEAALIDRSQKDIFRTGDRAVVTIYNVENLSGTFLVNRSGEIAFPLVGNIPVSGRTTQELQSDLVEAYGDTYLRNPSINVEREAAELGRIVVDGAVRRPGAFDLTEIIGLSEAIALAEGVTEDADPSDVYIIRVVDGQRRVEIADLRAIRTAAARDPQIVPGDIVFIQDSTGRVLFREFLRTVPLINTALIYGTRN